MNTMLLFLPYMQAWASFYAEEGWNETTGPVIQGVCWKLTLNLFLHCQPTWPRAKPNPSSASKLLDIHLAQVTVTLTYDQGNTNNQRSIDAVGVEGWVSAAGGGVP